MSNWEIKTEQINDDYYWGEFGGFRVIVREEDGYINGSRIVKDAGKRYAHWTDNKQTKELIRETSRLTGIPAADLMEAVNRGANNQLRGTYLHPLLVTHLALWCSPSFGAAAATWIEEWKKEDGNFQRYMRALSTMIPYANDQPEEAVQAMLAQQFDCQREVECVHGRIDLLTDQLIIEVKGRQDWMEGVGQLICYGSEHPELRRVLYTYDGSLSRRQRRVCRENGITSICSAEELDELVKSEDLAESSPPSDKIGQGLRRLIKMGTRQLDKLDRQEAQLDRQEAQLDDIGTKLGVARHHRVVLTSKDQDRNTLIIMDLHGRLRANRYNRYVIRCQHASAGSAINRIVRDYPQATVLHRIDYSPNSVLLWLRYLEKHGRHLERHGNYFDWKGISTEVGLAYLDAVHSERMLDLADG